MAVNKNALTRYHVLDKCFSNPVKKYFIEDLLQACNQALLEIDPDSNGIQKRQLADDISFMESSEGWEAPIGHIKEGRRTYYRYTDITYSIDNQPLNQAEIEQIKSALTILSRFSGMPQFEWVQEMTTKLEQTFLLEKQEETIISFDSNQYLKGIEYLGNLFHMILYKQPVHITYKAYKNENEQEMTIHPYHLKQYNNRWFLFGYNQAISRLTNLALDRIIDIREATVAYITNTTCDFNAYFEDIIGVTRMDNTEIQIIILHFDKSEAPYVLSKPLHGSQKKISDNSTGLTISIEVIPNYELESLILSFGEKVRVLSPDTFAAVVRKRVEKMAG